MAESTAPSSWQPIEDSFDFEPSVPKHIPRAWERAAKSPTTSRHKGRKIWKRYEAPPKGLEGKVEGGSELVSVLGDSTNTQRPVKRMRLKDAQANQEDGKENMATGFFTTLRDQAQETPRRKQISHHSLSPDRTILQSVDTEDDPLAVQGVDTIEDDVLRASESPALDDVRKILASTAHEHDVTENEHADIREDNTDNAGRSPFSESEGKDPHDANATFVQSAAPSSHDPTALSDPSHRNHEIESCHEESTGPDRLSSCFDLKEISDAPIAIAITERRDSHSASSVPGASPNATEHAAPKDGHEATSGDGHGPDLQASEICNPNDIKAGMDNHSLQLDQEKISDPTGVEQHVEKVIQVSPLKLEIISTESEDTASNNLDIAVTPYRSGSVLQASERTVSPQKANNNTPCNEIIGTRSPLSRKTPRSSPRKAMTPKTQMLKQVPVMEHIIVETPGGSPQIGTSLLRRESLRRKESPSKGTSLRKRTSPKKKDTLQRRDTLQEREILLRVIAEAAPTQNMEDVDDIAAGVTHATSSEPAPRQETPEINIQSSPIIISDDRSTSASATISAEAASPKLQGEGNKDLHRALEAIEAYETPIQTDRGDNSLAVSVDQVDMMNALDEANVTIAKMELEQATQPVEAKGQAESPKRKTRSAARFSDDTSMLKEFLNRAQAKKAAKTPALPKPDLPQPQISPRRSPRKALGSNDDSALSPQKSRDIANRPGTPPGKPQVEGHDSDDGDEISAEPSSCRRSTRTRLPAPSKTPPGAPSFIPVRRADGTDPVVLQKSQAQELAMVTRANTRRNKGQSKPPLLALHDLPVETAECASITRARGKQAKTVGWAERLASYQDAKDTEEAEEARPKVRRMKGLGSANGTPGPKRATAVVGTSNGTPAPKRRSMVL